MNLTPEERSQVEAFQTQGYHLVRNVLSPARVAEVRAFLKTQFDQRYQDEDLMRTDVLYDFHCAFPELFDTFANSKLVNTLNLLLGQGFVLLPAVHCLRNSFAQLHTDTTTIEALANDWVAKPDFKFVTVGIYLQDCDEQGGGLFVVPGTHRNPDPIVKRRQLSDGKGVPFFSKVLRKLTHDRFPNYSDYSKYEKGGLNLPTKAGDAAVFSMRILHRGSAAVAERRTSKMGLFFHATPPGPYVQDFLRYCDSRKDQNHLRGARNLAPLQKAAEPFGFTVL